MASVRSFKKDIDYLLSLVLEDCVTVMENHPEIEREKVMAVAQQVILNHMELRRQVNHIDGKENPAVVKKYMKTLAHKLYTVANDSLGELNKLVAK